MHKRENYQDFLKWEVVFRPVRGNIYIKFQSFSFLFPNNNKEIQLLSIALSIPELQLRPIL